MLNNDVQFLAQYGFAALVAWYALTQLNKTMKENSRQIRLNTIVLAKISGMDYHKICREFEAEENGEGAS